MESKAKLFNLSIQPTVIFENCYHFDYFVIHLPEQLQTLEVEAAEGCLSEHAGPLGSAFVALF